VILDTNAISAFADADTKFLGSLSRSRNWRFPSLFDLLSVGRGTANFYAS
jgi:hypothetical protein